MRKAFHKAGAGKQSSTSTSNLIRKSLIYSFCTLLCVSLARHLLQAVGWFTTFMLLACHFTISLGAIYLIGVGENPSSNEESDKVDLLVSDIPVSIKCLVRQ
jgi:hypothetical protein